MVVLGQSRRLDTLVASLDPDVREAIGEVDRSLILLSLAQSPRDRLRSASNMARVIVRFRREAPPPERR